MNEPLPALRPVEMIPTKHEGRVVVVVRDPEGVCEGMIVLPLPAYFIASCFDGASRLSDVQAAFQRQFGQTIKDDDILSLNRQLDEHGLLLTSKYFARKKALEDEYEALPARPATHAGQAYPDDPEALKATFEAYFTLEGGAGALDGSRGQGTREVAGIVLPHIDPRCGGRCASWGLKALAESPRPDVFVIFGTSHQPMPELFSVSEKDFQTPLGQVSVDKEFIQQLRRNWRKGRFSGSPLVHKSEHSIEFQVMFLHALYGEPAPFTIVPILCSSLHEFMEQPERLRSDEDIAQFCDAVKRAAAASGKRVCYVAGADLSHMGRKFGDEFGLSDELIERTKKHDLQALEAAARLDFEGFFGSIACDGDSYKVCGTPPMHAMMRCMEATEGRLLNYDLNLEASTDSMVSFCSMVFYK